MKQTILIHYAEIALKKKNRNFFEKKLIENIRNKFRADAGGDIKKLRGRVILALSRQGINKEKIEKKLSQIFGIAWFAFVNKTESNIEKIKTLVKQSAKKISSKQTFAVRTVRADKNFPLQSIKVEKILGKLIQEKTNSKVNLSNPDKTLFVEITSKETFIFWDKIKGPGGLPVGVSGKVICLFSGGIDSVAATYLMGKRGAKPILVHFSAIPLKLFQDAPLSLRGSRCDTGRRGNLQEKENKIIKIHKKLQDYIGQTKLYIISYDQFQMAVLSLSGRAARYEILLFRRFMRKVAEKIAQKEKAQALATGDNLGQVASQTLENLAIFDKGASMPIFRPLLGFDKQEIIDFAKNINTYELSILPYKDCCSIIQKNPTTRGKWEVVKRLEKEIEMEKIVEKSLKEMTKI